MKHLIEQRNRYERDETGQAERRGRMDAAEEDGDDSGNVTQHIMKTLSLTPINVKVQAETYSRLRVLRKPADRCKLSTKTASEC